MVELNDMSEEEKKNVIIGMYLGSFYSPIWFLKNHYGEEALQKYFEENAKAYAEMMKAFKVDNPLEFLRFYAMNEKNIFKSDVTLKGNEEKAVMEVKDCTKLKHAVQWAKYGKGPENDITKEKHCLLCLKEIYEPVAEALGFKFESKISPNGCKIIVSKIGEK